MKKLTSLILSIILILGVFPANAANNAPIRDTNKLDVVKSLGILDAYSQHEPDENPITRGEFAFVLSRLLNYDLTSEAESLFADVTRANPYYDAIMTMASMEIMVGDEMGNFCPEEPVTVASAAKCLIYILGYSFLAEAEGYPKGYLERAKSLDIFDGMSGETYGVVSRSALAEMIYNSLDVTILEPDLFSEKVVYTDENGETILSKYHNIIKGEGIVNAVDGRSIKTGVIASAEGFVQIDDTSYQYTDMSIADYLGNRIEYYVTEENEYESYETLICFFAHSKNVELLIPVKDLDITSPSFSLRNFCYTDNKDKKREAEITDKHRFVFNGAYDLDFDVQDLNFETGYVKLIDNNNDKIYDVVIVWSYENYVVESVNEDRVLCHYNKMLKKDSQDTLYRVYGKNGSRGGWELLDGINNWSVLSVARSKDNRLVTIHISDGGVSGTIEAIYNDNSITALIDGQEYTVSGNYSLLAGSSDYVQLKVGVESEFYFDIMGEIAGVYSVRSTDFQYGYLLKVRSVDEPPYKYSVKIFTMGGEIEYFYAKDRIRLKSALVNNKISSDTAFGEFLSGGQTAHQLIRYKTDEEGNLTAIEKAVTATTVGYNTNEFSKDFDIGSTEYRFENGTLTFGDKTTFNDMFHVNSMTTVFYLPIINGELSDEDAVVTDINMFEHGSSYTDIKVYDCDDTYQAPIVVYTPAVNSVSTTTFNSEYFIAVSKVYRALDKDDIPVDIVRGYYRGAEKEWEYISQDGSVPEKGSIIRCETTFDGDLIVNRGNVVYSPTATTQYFNNKNGDPFPNVWVQYGRLFRKNGVAISVYDGSSKPMANYLRTGYTVYKVSPEKVSISSEAELYASTGVYGADGTLVSGAIDGTLMLINNRQQYVREIFIIDENY